MQDSELRTAGAPFAKYFISPGKRQGSAPFLPIPFDMVAATMAVRLGEDGGEGMVVVLVVVERR